MLVLTTMNKRNACIIDGVGTSSVVGKLELLPF